MIRVLIATFDDVLTATLVTALHEEVDVQPIPADSLESVSRAFFDLAPQICLIDAELLARSECFAFPFLANCHSQGGARTHMMLIASSTEPTWLPRSVQISDERVLPREGFMPHAVPGRLAMLIERLRCERRATARAAGAQRTRPVGLLQVIGTSPATGKLKVEIVEVASSDDSALITGETGAGKDVAAKTIHSMSPRRRGPFQRANCIELSETVFESELFGHERGAFTGA